MTEISYWWSTSGTPSGHQVSSYSQAHLTEIVKLIAATHGLEGVAPAYLNTLNGSVPAANTFRVASGGAIVDGKPYKSDANVDVNIPSAVGGGNTRIDRIVLRAVWASFTVTITRIAGTDAASPTPPAITQTPGTTYDIMLYQVLVNTSGTVTLQLDERVWARISTAEIDDAAITAAKIAADAVTTAKILDANVTTAKLDATTAGKLVTNGDSHDHNGGDGAAIPAGGLADGAVNTTAKLANDVVDDTKVGNRVPQFYRRQGGDASNWSTVGTTTYTPTAVRMQGGTIEAAILAGGNYAFVTVTFPQAFSNVPIILISPGAGIGDLTLVTVYSITSSQFQFEIFRSGTSGNAYTPVYWLAIGPE